MMCHALHKIEALALTVKNFPIPNGAFMPNSYIALLVTHTELRCHLLAIKIFHPEVDVRFLLDAVHKQILSKVCCHTIEFSDK